MCGCRVGVMCGAGGECTGRATKEREGAADPAAGAVGVLLGCGEQGMLWRRRVAHITMSFSCEQLISLGVGWCLAVPVYA